MQGLVVNIKLKCKCKVLYAFILLFIFCENALSQTPVNDSINFKPETFIHKPADAGKPETLNKKRLTTVVVIGGTAYVVGMAGLYQLWFKDYPSESFHFFNDNGEWLQVDKCGHAFSTYQIGLYGIDALKWTGLERKKAIWYGAGYAYLFQTTIEVFDGFSTGWGFSKGDMLANTIGAGMLVTQELLWNEQRFRIKFSYHASPYANERPELLGESAAQRLFKDYNGQTYWLNCNIACWLNRDTKFPKWLTFAFGYGANGMIGGSSNPTTIDGQPAPYYPRYRQFYFAPDIDLTKIKTKSKALKTIFNVVGFLKVPMPTLEYNSQNKFVFHPLFF